MNTQLACHTLFKVDILKRMADILNPGGYLFNSGQAIAPQFQRQVMNVPAAKAVS